MADIDYVYLIITRCYDIFPPEWLSEGNTGLFVSCGPDAGLRKTRDSHPVSGHSSFGVLPTADILATAGIFSTADKFTTTNIFAAANLLATGVPVRRPG